MIPTFNLNHKNIDTAGSRLLFQSKIDNPGHGRIIWAPYLFTLEKSYFSIENDANKEGGFYIYSNMVDTYYLCAILNSASYKKRIFGNNLRPFATYNLGLTQLLNLDILLVDENVQHDISILELIIQFLHHEELTSYQLGIREYMISQFEDVRDAIVLELLFPLFFRAHHLFVRLNWSESLTIYGSANKMTESIDNIFKLLNDNTNPLGNTIKRLKVLLNSLPKR